jgi:glucose/arabinose dehydrogenase/cytochrome c553
MAYSRRITLAALALVTTGALSASAMTGGEPAAPAAAPHEADATACPGDNGGLSLPPGFCATVFADNLGHVRHMTVRADGVLYVNTWSGRYFPTKRPPDAGFFIALEDTKGAGKADVIERFGPKPLPAPAFEAGGGSGVALYRQHIYFDHFDKIIRYALPPGQLTPKGEPEVVLSGLPLTGDHYMHPFVISPKGDLFVDVGSATNSCQPQNRRAGVPGAEPCTELETRAGTWRYDAGKLGQVFSPTARYATGLRNGEGLAWDAAGRFYATQHGRDQLEQNWGKLYPDADHTTELPAEELVVETDGADFGWPYCYYDGFQKKLVLAPEYGGDGGKAVGVCAQKTPPVAYFPAHWGPNGLAIYLGKAFPIAYRGGAYIAFHGSWNRAPAPQAGYNVVYQPLKNGKAAGPWVVFADGFAGAVRDPAKAVYRPTGLAVAPDGALFISDDVQGRIWRVTYHGAMAVALQGAREVPGLAAATAPIAQPGPSSLPIPAGSSAAEVAEGARVFRSTTCGGCHGMDGSGSPLAPSLTSGPWLWGGSLDQITASIQNGIPAPKQYRSPMPAMGGANLSPSDLKAVSAYVWAIGRSKGP